MTRNAQISYPAIGKGLFQGILLIPSSGIADMNETIGVIHKYGPKSPTPLWRIAQYLSERSFEVIRHDKRGVGANQTILNSDAWENVTTNDLIR